MQAIIYWITQIAKPEDLIVIVGDYNADLNSETYNYIVEQGFISSYK